MGVGREGVNIKVIFLESVKVSASTGGRVPGRAREGAWASGR